MASRFFLSNDVAGSAYNEQTFFYTATALSADDTTLNVIGVVPEGKTGKVVSAFLLHGTNGTDATDTATNELDVTINGTSVFTTKPKLSYGTTTAGSGRVHTLAAGTGIVVAALNSAAVVVTAGDILHAKFDVTITTPDTNPADVCAVVTVRWDAA
jgi:hypothetical protein